MKKHQRQGAAWLALLLLGCSQAPPGSPGASSARDVAPRPVHLIEVGTTELPRHVAVTGVLSAQEELVLGMQVQGRLQTLAVDLGDAVEEGTVIAAMDPRDFALERDRALAAVIAAHARLGCAETQDLASIDVETTAPVKEAHAVVGEARLQRERIVTMVQEQLRASSDLETADATLAVATSRLQRARDEVRTWLAEARQRRVELDQAKKREQDARLQAPWRGRVAARHATAGQVLSAGAPVVTLLRTDPLRLQLAVPERLAGAVVVGQDVEFTVDGRLGEARTGKIVRLGAGVDRRDRTLHVEAEVANADRALLPGAFCRAHIVVRKAEPVVVVPRTAVVTFAGIDRVFTVPATTTGPHKAKGAIVELGRDLGDRIEIVRGVAVGTRIVVDAQGLSNDAAVAVVQ